MYKQLTMLAAILSLSSAVAFAEPVTGTYKLVSETITNPDPACISIVNSGIYFGDSESPTTLKYNQATHTLTIGPGVPDITFTPTRAGKSVVDISRGELTAHFVFAVNSPATGNSFEVIAFSQMSQGGKSQTCSNVAVFGLSSSNPNAG